MTAIFPSEISSFFSQTVGFEDIQSLVQLAIALNFAFGAYDSIRLPIIDNMNKIAIAGVKKAEDLVKKLEPLDNVSSFPYPEEFREILAQRFRDYAAVRAAVYNLSLYQGAQKLFGNKYPYLAVRTFASLGLLGMIILILTPLSGELEFGIFIYSIVVVVLFGPVLLHILINLLVSKSLMVDTEKLQSEIDSLHQISRNNDAIYAPAVRRLIKMGLAKTK